MRHDHDGSALEPSEYIATIRALETEITQLRDEVEHLKRIISYTRGQGE